MQFFPECYKCSVCKIKMSKHLNVITNLNTKIFFHCSLELQRTAFCIWKSRLRIALQTSRYFQCKLFSRNENTSIKQLAKFNILTKGFTVYTSLCHLQKAFYVLFDRTKSHERNLIPTVPGQRRWVKC